MKTNKVTTATLLQMKQNGEKITLIPVYDYLFAKILDECKVDVLLVGDSVGSRLMGRKDDLSVTVEEMIYHTQAVVRGAERAMVITDMPFGSYINIDDAKKNATRLVKEGGADAIKIEGGVEIADTISAIVGSRIPVYTHVEIPDQSIKQSSMHEIKGETKGNKERLLKAMKTVEEAGAFMVGLMNITTDVAGEISRMLKIPTIGIGAGPYCDGFAISLYSIIGLTLSPEPKPVRRYACVRDTIADAVKQFIREVKEGDFPNEEHD